MEHFAEANWFSAQNQNLVWPKAGLQESIRPAFRYSNTFLYDWHGPYYILLNPKTSDF